MKENIKNTISAAYLLNIVSRGCDILFYYLLFKYLPIELVGKYSWLMALAALASLLLDLGIGQSLVRGFSSNQISLNMAVKNSFTIRLPGIILLLLVLILWNSIYNPVFDLFISCFIVGIIQLFLAGELLLLSWLKANGKQTVANTLAIIEPSGRLIAFILIILMTTENINLSILFFAFLLVHIFVISILTLSVKKYYNVTNVNDHMPETWLPDRQLLSSSLTFGLIGLCTVSQNRLDWLLVSNLVSKVELANYSLANKIYEIFLNFTGVAITTIYPWLCKTENSLENKQKINLLVILINCSGITLAALLSLYLPDILFFVWGNKYAASNDMIRLIMLGAAFSVIISTAYYMVIAQHLEKSIIPITIFSSLVQLLANVVLIPRIGGYGAVIGMLALIIITALGFAYVVHRKKLEYTNVLLRISMFLLLLLLVTYLTWILSIGIISGVILISIISVAATYFIFLNHDEKLILKNLVSKLIEVNA